MMKLKTREQILAIRNPKEELLIWIESKMIQFGECYISDRMYWKVSEEIEHADYYKLRCENGLVKLTLEEPEA